VSPRSARYRKLARTARTVARGLQTTLMAAILVVGVLRAGTRYFYCEAMETVFAAPCCGGSSHHADAGSAQIEAHTDDCCKPHTLGSLPAAAIPIVASPLPPPLLAVLQPAIVQLPLLPAHSTVSRGAQTGPPPLSAANDRSRLMVFLI
jgi:hypothetical protein